MEVNGTLPDSGPSLQPDVGSFSRLVTRNVYLVVLSRNEPHRPGRWSHVGRSSERSIAHFRRVLGHVDRRRLRGVVRTLLRTGVGPLSIAVHRRVSGC